MAFYGYRGDARECYWTPYDTVDYDHFVPTQASSTCYSSYEYGEPEFAQFNSSSSSSCYDNYYSFPANPLGIHFSVYNHTEPELILYEPSKGFDSFTTQYTVSYSVNESRFADDTLFVEYDPTPYSGGYDPTKTYGSSLPPSDDICYPNSNSQSDQSVSLEGFSYKSIPSPYGEDQHPPKPSQKDEKPKPQQEPRNDQNENKVNGTSIRDPHNVDTSDESHSDDDGDEGYGNGGSGESYEYGSFTEVSQQVPYGSGLEAMDLCESIFGYWPCLAKRNQMEKSKCICHQFYDEERDNPWKHAADYLFGPPIGCYNPNDMKPHHGFGYSSWS